MNVTVHDFYMGGLMPEDFDSIRVTMTEQYIADLEIEKVFKIERSGDVVDIGFENTDGHDDWIEVGRNDFIKMEVHYND